MLARRRKIERWLSFGERNDEMFTARIIRGVAYVTHKVQAITATIRKRSFSSEYNKSHFGSLLLIKACSKA